MKQQTNMQQVQTLPKNTQLDLIEHGVFNGKNYEPLVAGYSKLTGKTLEVYELMKDGKFRTLADIEKATKIMQTTISATLRHLRKQKYGAHKLNKRRSIGKQYEYQLIISFN